MTNQTPFPKGNRLHDLGGACRLFAGAVQPIGTAKIARPEHVDMMGTGLSRQPDID